MVLSHIYRSHNTSINYKMLVAPGSCFVYGTLMSEEVLHCLLGRIPQMLPNVLLSNHVRHPVRNHVYPGVIPSETSSSAAAAVVEGILLFGLSPFEINLLDYFEEESVDYKRADVQVQITNINSLDKTMRALLLTSKAAASTTTTDGSSNSRDDDYLSSMISSSSGGYDGMLMTQAYIWIKDISQLDLTKEWDYKHFRKEHLDWYLKNTVKPCRVEAEKSIS